MEEETENQTPATTSPWLAAIVGSAVTAIIAAGGLFALHDRLVATITAEATHTEASISRLTSRITALEAQTATLAQAAQPDPAPIQALNTGLATTSSKLGELASRLETLEKQQVQGATPVAAMKVETITSPTITDDALRAELVTILNALPKPVATATSPSPSFIQTLNTRFDGFISIKKNDGVDVYANLRNTAGTANLETLAQEIQQLNDTARAPFAPWLANYQAAQKTAATPSPLMGR
jgi:prefoldin subunit 5